MVKARRRRAATATLSLLPSWVIVLVAYIGTMIWTVWISLTNSKLLPVNTFAGFDQYVRLAQDSRWLLSIGNMAIFGVMYIGGCLVLGFLLAVAIDQKVRTENTLRTIFLYPSAMSFIVTGLIWQWMMNPGLGIQKAMRDLGLEGFTFDWVVQRDMALYALVIAGLWHSAGLVMVLMLAGLRGVDAELWKATKVDGIPAWRVYISIVVPLLRPMIVTAVVLLSIATVKVYDLVVALTNGGPGTASEMPAKFVMDYLFTRQNIGLATAASTVMLITVLLVLAPWLYSEHFRRRRARGAA
jgi:glucose/mannose transport system permease protein